ncbi:MAG: putative rane protein [Prosthecobacter sp.]|nr:putative rane protein [Prosthecobacter sp.]
MQTIVKAAFLYLFLLGTLRITTRKGLRASASIHMILIFLFGGMALQTILGEDRSLTNAMLGITTVGGVHVLISTLKMRFPFVARLVDGTPVIVREGKEWNDDRLKSLSLTKNDIHAFAREQGMSDLDIVELVLFERNGMVTFIKKEQA